MIIGVAVGLGVVLLIVVAIVRIGGSASSPSAAGDYTLAGLRDGCDVVDPSPLEQWAVVRSGIDQTDSPPSTSHGGHFRCTIRNQDHNVAEVRVQASINAPGGEPSYFENKNSRKQFLGTGGVMTDVSGVGEQAFETVDAVDCFMQFAGGCLTYELGLLDSNLSLLVRVKIELGTEGDRIDKDAVAGATRMIAQQVMGELRR
ncbi:hypothetical protein [Nocardia goodfellowii]|uniref:DUF3558 domain-containing protein n=1 Tax=Nocardia goodfellowii TaxID=882446 RepID=A0ABS4QNP9_9NOCA|nr:hypothetical protein [Nocardia goodfellowii]MBP2193334.1 hypothetical protein [Nocardia goodfellowii]